MDINVDVNQIYLSAIHPSLYSDLFFPARLLIICFTIFQVH